MMTGDQDKYRELQLFFALAIAGIVAALNHVHIPHTDALIDGRWAFGFMGFVLLGHWWSALALAVLLSYPYGSPGIPVWVGFWGNMLYAVPCLLLIRPLSGWMVRRMGLGWRFGLGWLALVLACYQVFITPVVWAVIALLDGRPAAAGVLDGWRTQPLLVESILVALFSAAALVAVLAVKGLQAQRRRLEHINRILRGIRDVNQLIVREKEREPLIEAAVQILTSIRGFQGAWIVLTDRLPGELQSAQAGFPDDAFRGLTARVKAGGLPLCCERARDGNCVVTVIDPAQAFGDCPLAHVYRGAAGMGVCLTHGDMMFGCMGVSMPPEYANDKQDQSLLSEIAGDIAFALWAIETETQRDALGRKYGAVLSATSDAVLAFDLNGQITVFNSGAEKLFGCTAGEALGTPIVRFCPEDRLAEQAEKMRRVREEGTVAGYETERLTASGRRIPVEITLGLNTDDRGQPRGINAILRDITNRKQAEAALRESEAHLRSTVDGLSAHIAVLDERGEIILTNKAYRDFGARNSVDPTAAFEGTNYLAVCDIASGEHSEEAGPFAAGIREVLSGKIPSFELEYPCHSADEKRWFIGRVTPINGEGPRRVVVAHENITEWKRAEERRQEGFDLLNNLACLVPGVIYQYRLYPDGRSAFPYSSPGMYDIYEVTPEEVREDASAVFGRLHPEDHDRVAAAIFESARTLNTFHCELRVILPKQGLRWRWSQAHPERTADGGTLWHGIILDITERKQAEEAQRHWHELMQYVIQYTNSAVAVHDRELRYMYVSERYLIDYQVQEQEIIGKHHYDVFPDLPEKWREVHRKALAGEVSSSERDPYERADGTVEWTRWECRPWYEANGAIGGIIVYTEVITERVQAEEALRESEERFLLAMQASHDGLFDWNLETNEIYYSPGWKKMLGYEDHELPNDFSVWENTTDPEDVKKSWELQQQLITKQIDRFVLEFKMKHKDGYWIDVLSRAKAIFNDSGKAVRIVGTHTDITAQKKAEAQVKLSEKNLRNIADTMQETLSVIALDGTFLYANQKAARNMSGGKTGDISGKNIRELIPEDQAESLIEDYQSVYQSGEPFHQEIEIGLNKANTWFFNTLKPIEYGSPPLPAVLSVSLDITERKQAEEALVRQQRAIKLTNRIANVFLTSSRDEVFADVLDVILMALDSRFGYFGYIDEAGDLVCPSLTRDIWDQCRATDKSIVFPRAGWGGLWGRSLLEKQTLIANENLRIPEGHATLDNALATPIVYNDNLIGQFVVANKAGGYDKDDRDLLENAATQTAPILFAIREEARQKTAHKKLEERLRQSQKMEAVGQLAGGIAHDFNNILVPIIGYAELGMMGLSSNDRLYANLQHIHRAAEQAAALTRQILAFSRKQVLEMKSLNLNEVVTNFEKMLRRLIGENIMLKVILSPTLASVHADPAQIEQILMNLAINARDAMPRGGKLTIETDNLFLDEAYAHTHIEVQPGPYVMLAVSDTGIGMDSETKEHIFEPFFTTKPQGAGTGLGLATIFGIVKQHQGHIWVYSEPGQGTTFKVYLPQANVTKPDMTATRQSDLFYGTETILLVEDEVIVRQLACETLTAHGYTVLEAQSPTDALCLAADYQDTINLLLTDVIMPEMNGRQLYEKVAAIRPEINVLYMSGYTDNVIVHHGVLQQDVNFLQKPFTVHRLTQKVRETLR